MNKRKLVLDVLDDGTWNIDVRKMDGVTTGHILLSPTGISWKNPRGQCVAAGEVEWDNVKNQLLK